MHDVILIVLGLFGLILAGDLLVRGSVAIAWAAGLSPMVIGLTLVGFGTSAPELMTSLQAAAAGSPGIAIGNVIGSNIGNILLILGLAAAMGVILVDRAALRRDGTTLAVASLAVLAVFLTGEMTRGTGVVLFLALAAYLAYTLITERRRTAAAAVYTREAELPAPLSTPKALVFTVAGLVGTILSAKVLVSGGIGIAQAAGLSESLIGLTLIAVGTSMPELATSVVAMRRGQGDVALGNIIGSNIFNLLGILGITAMVQPLTVPSEIVRFDIWIMLAATAALVVFAVTGARITRREGLVLLVGYAGYLAVLSRSV